VALLNSRQTPKDDPAMSFLEHCTQHFFGITHCYQEKTGNKKIMSKWQKKHF